MFEIEVQKCTRRCAKTERDLQPGETVYSVLLADGADVVRVDYAVDAWEGPPEDAIGVWKTQIPESDARKVNWAPNDVMLDYFRRLEGQAEKLETRYVLALLLVRRRIARLEDSETNDQGHEVMVLACPQDETVHRVVVAAPSHERIRAIQEELAQLLFGNAEK